MFSLIATNRYVYLKGADIRTTTLLDRVSSYKVAGAEYTEGFRRKRWDGKEHLLKLHSASGRYRAPIGLLEDFRVYLNEKGIDHRVIYDRRKMHPKVDYKWDPTFIPRPYQNDAEAAIIGCEYKSGILKMPIRSGKTKTCGRIIYRLKRKSLFIVPSQLLLYQTQKALAEVLQVEVGIIGDNEWIERDVTVASIQTLIHRRGNTERSMTAEYKRLTRSYDLVVFDECHHLKGEAWRKVMLDMDAPYKIGLSATAYLDLESECERGVIWLKGCCGNIRHEVPTSELIEEGYLMRPHIWLYRMDGEEQHPYGWNAKLLKELIHQNTRRNQKIADVAHELVHRGLNVLIITNRLRQAQMIGRMLKLKDISFTIIVGNTKKEDRERRLEAFRTGKAKVLIGTVFGEGIDIPEMETVINAEGGKDVKATVQRMRNLTPHDGKTDAIFVDFMDLTNKYTAQHSLQRLQTYRSEPAFRFEIKD